MVLQPPALRIGDKIGIMCPSGYMPIERTESCVSKLTEWGFQVERGQTLYGHSDNYFSGTDRERAEDLQRMLDDDSIHAILFGRGGYGMSRIIDQLDFSRFLKHPKWIAGYSDITVLLAHLFTRYGIASLHSPMAGAFQDHPEDDIYLTSIHKMFIGEAMNYSVPGDRQNRPGEGVGPLIGGNLALFTHLIGTSSFPDTSGAILFLEDVGEQLYNIDRMLLQLKRGGQLDRLGGLVFGGFTDCKDTDRPFGTDLYSILQQVVADYEYPVCYDFPVSHTARNYALKYGVRVCLRVQDGTVELKELIDHPIR